MVVSGGAGVVGVAFIAGLVAVGVVTVVFVEPEEVWSAAVVVAVVVVAGEVATGGEDCTGAGD